MISINAQSSSLVQDKQMSWLFQSILEDIPSSKFFTRIMKSHFWALHLTKKCTKCCVESSPVCCQILSCGCYLLKQHVWKLHLLFDLHIEAKLMTLLKQFSIFPLSRNRLHFHVPHTCPCFKGIGSSVKILGSPKRIFDFSFYSVITFLRLFLKYSPLMKHAKNFPGRQPLCYCHFY